MKHQQILPANVARILIKTSRLCTKCLQRQGVSRALVRANAAKDSECEICGGLLANLSRTSDLIAEKLREYEFETFLIGISLPQRILDKEDELRSRLKIKGRQGVKSEITKSLNSVVSKGSKKRLDYLRPDLTLLVSLPHGDISITPRSIWLSVKYCKTVRGIAQRSSLCRICNGVGCAVCNYRGVSLLSVQYLVSNFLLSKFRAENCGFIWVGSEDGKSLVGGPGRPFFVEVQKPKRRTLVRPLRTAKLNGVTLSSIELLHLRPTSIPQFTMSCFAYLIPSSFGDPSQVPKVMKEEIESKFKDITVTVRATRRFRVVAKRIRSILVHETNGDRRVVLEINCDGGVPIKKLVSGEDDCVLPNLAPFIMGLKLDPEMPFDVANIILDNSRSPKEGSLLISHEAEPREDLANGNNNPAKALKTVSEEIV
jgi:tRNA pseudouridine synthase 10